MRHSTQKLELIGRRFGKLTVVRSSENIGSRTAWVCRCDCGRETIVKTVYLREGKVTSCGCAREGGAWDIGTGLNYIDGTCVEMLRAKTVRSNNTSGIPGVDWLSSRQRWRATICFQGKRYYLGRYENFEDAVAARKKAEEQLHDRFLEAFDHAAKENG